MQEFYNKWRSEPLQQSSRYPYVVALETDDVVRSFLWSGVTVNKIIVTEAYEAMYHRIVNIREDQSGRGVLLTGQPGIGTSPITLRQPPPTP